jgi:hypothetical protein
MKTNILKLSSLLGIGALLLVGAGVTPAYATSTNFIANADVATTFINTPVEIDVFNNDSGNVNEYTLSSTQGNHGFAIVMTSGANYSVRYYPSYNYTGTDSFTYTACSSFNNSQCSSAVVNVTINAGSSFVDYGNLQNNSGSQTRSTINLLNSDCRITSNEIDQEPTLAYGNLQNSVAPQSTIVTSGLLSFKSTNCTETGVELTTENQGLVITDLTKLKALKYGISPDGSTKWFDFTNKVTFKYATANNLKKIIATYNLTDGGLGDDGLNGQVNDPISIVYNGTSTVNNGTSLVRTGGIF